MDPFSLVIPVSKELSKERSTLLRWVVNRYRGFWDEDALTIILGTDDSPQFNRARARNRGLAEVETEFVVIADGDTAFDPIAIDEGLELLDLAPWVIPYGDKDYYNLTQEYTRSILQDPMDPILDPVWDHRIKSWAGLLIARTQDCLDIGYDEEFELWGWEDVAFRVQMDAEIGRHQRVDHGRALHLWHSRSDLQFGTPEEIRNRDIFDAKYRRKYNWRDERLR
jgi:hypothetical protein